MECSLPNNCTCIDGWTGTNCSIGIIHLLRIKYVLEYCMCQLKKYKILIFAYNVFFHIKMSMNAHWECVNRSAQTQLDRFHVIVKTMTIIF